LVGDEHAGFHAFPDITPGGQQLHRLDLADLAAGSNSLAPGLSGGPIQSVVRRGLDIAASLFMLVFTLPLLLLIALVIRLDSPGPILSRRQCVGRHGRVFTLLRFRSMRAGVEIADPAWVAQGDPRVTRVGDVLWRTRMDGLPQLLNVLRGDMSLVGPRPQCPALFARLRDEIPFYDCRTTVKPGVTGWAQIHRACDTSIEDARRKLSYDLYYMKRRSLLLDVLILLATVGIIRISEQQR